MPYSLEPNKEYAECPRCKYRADGLCEIERNFGWRNPNGTVIPQSHCKKCRTEEKKDSSSSFL